MGKQTPTLRRDDLERLINSLYASAVGDAPWTLALEHLTRAFGANGCVLNVSDGAAMRVRGFQAYNPPDLPLDAYYASELFRSDPRLPFVASVRHGTIYYDRMMYDLAEIERNATYQENVALLGVKYSLGAKVALPHGTTATLAVVATAAQGHASLAAIDAMQRLLPHIERALTLAFFVEGEAMTRCALLEGLARKADGLILIGEDGRPSFLNERASAILNAGDGLSLTDGQFATARLPETKKLLGLIQSAGAPSLDEAGGGRMLVNRVSRDHPYIVYVCPARRSERFLTVRRIASVMYIVDLCTTPVVSKSALRELLGLSERESDLAVELLRANGNFVQAAANAGMTVNTARNHLQSIFGKTGVHTQSELSRILSRII